MEYVKALAVLLWVVAFPAFFIFGFANALVVILPALALTLWAVSEGHGERHKELVEAVSGSPKEEKQMIDPDRFADIKKRLKAGEITLSEAQSEYEELRRPVKRARPAAATFLISAPSAERDVR